MKSTTSDVPAIAGGLPAKTEPYGTWKRYGDEELRELKDALEQGTLFYFSGTKVRAMEEEVARLHGARFAVATTSGTASVHAAMIAAGISPGDEVITAPITDMGSVIPILFQGAVPVFADLEPHTYVLSPQAVEASITDRTRAVLAVHLWGNACDMTALKDICRRHDLTLIEDCAQAWGCTYRDRPAGTWGDIGCFSFNEFKHISCGDGGVVITDSEPLAERLRLATDKGYSREPGALVRNATFLANNYRMTELQGAVALAQLRKLDDIVAKRRRWCEALSQQLSGIEGLHVPQATLGCDPAWWFYMMRVHPGDLGADADTFVEALSAEGLPVRAHYIGQCVYESPIFVDHSAFAHAPHPFEARHYGKGLCTEAEAILDTCVILSINEAYTEVDLAETARAINRVAKWCQSKTNNTSLSQP